MNNIKISKKELMVNLKKADIPILLMVLLQLTGDKKWIQHPYLPARDLAFFPDESGGLSPTLQNEIRIAVCEKLLAYFDGKLKTAQNPSRELYVEMMSVCVGEAIPSEYLEMMLEEMGFEERKAMWIKQPEEQNLNGFKCLIIGAGMSGLCAAIKFKEAGIPIEIVEKNRGLGGTWHENKYPGVGCDVPNHFYSYSFWPNMDWTEYFSPGDEIETYLKNCAKEFEVDNVIQFEKEVISAEFDTESSLWHVEIIDRDGVKETKIVNVVVFATGQLNQPKIPDIPGIDNFTGVHFHSARWPENLSLAGKKIVVIGTGASAMQLAPSVAKQVDQLVIFQRSAQWAIPTRDYHRIVSPEKKWLLKFVPFYAEWYRFSLVWRFSDRLLASVRKDPDWAHPQRSLNARNDRHRSLLTKYIREELGEDPDLLQKSLPKYPPYGKRILVDNNWFKTLRQDNVKLVTDPIIQIRETSVVSKNGEEYDADIIVFATGFNASQTLGSTQISIKNGLSLNTLWGDDNPRAYLGMTTPGFPNLFFLYGPNANLGHGGSIIFISELQVRYVLNLLMKMIENGITEIECLEKVHDDYNQKLDREHDELIWTHPGITSWYKNQSGRIVSIMPWRLVDYWKFTREPKLIDYKVKS